MIRGAIFDMDGLLFDTERLFQISWAQTARDMGFAPDPNFPRAICGTSGLRAREIVRARYPGADADAFIESGVRGVDRLMEESIPIKPGVFEMLDFLKGYRLPIAVASSNTRENIAKYLDRSHLAPYFDAIVSSDSVAHGKPAPDVFLAAASALKQRPEDCFVFEDGINGVKAGIAAGCVTIMIPDLIPPTPECYKGCAGIFESLNQALWDIRRKQIA